MGNFLTERKTFSLEGAFKQLASRRIVQKGIDGEKARRERHKLERKRKPRIRKPTGPRSRRKQRRAETANPMLSMPKMGNAHRVEMSGTPKSTKRVEGR